MTVRVGRPTGIGASVTFNRSLPNGLSIPDGDFIGVADNFAVGQDLQIADLELQVDSLTLTYVTSEYKQLVAFGLLILVLVLRPTGLFGQRSARADATAS